VTLTWPWAEEREGGGREESVARRPAPFEAEAGDAGEGWASRGVRRRVDGKNRGGVRGFGDVDQHGKDAVGAL
jgi:hypothetical protein